jgi:hypothetical protein
LLVNFASIKIYSGQISWLMPIILPTPEAQIWKSAVGGKPGQKDSEILSEK